MCRAAVGIGFQSPTPIPYPQKNLWESPQSPHTYRTPKSSIYMPQTLCIFVRCIFNKHIYAVFSNDNKKNNASSKTDYKLDCIWRNSNSEYDI